MSLNEVEPTIWKLNQKCTKNPQLSCVYGLVIHAATPTAGRGSSKLSFTIRDSVEDTINVEIKLDNNQTALDYYQNFNFMDTIVKVTNPDFIQNEESDLLHRPFTLGDMKLSVKGKNHLMLYQTTDWKELSKELQEYFTTLHVLKYKQLFWATTDAETKPIDSFEILKLQRAKLTTVPNVNIIFKISEFMPFVYSNKTKKGLNLTIRDKNNEKITLIIWSDALLKYFDSESRKKSEQELFDVHFVAYQLEFFYYEKRGANCLQSDNKSIIFEIYEDKNVSIMA